MHLAGDTSTYQRKYRAAIVSIQLICLFFKTSFFLSYIRSVKRYCCGLLPCRAKACAVVLFSPLEKGGSHYDHKQEFLKRC